MALTKISRGLLSTGISDSSDATAITIDSSENVGIGTTSPDGKLDVRGTIFVNGDGTGGRIFASSGNLSLSDGNGRQILRIDDPGSGNSHSHIFDSNGRLGVGTTSPDNTLHVDASGGGTIKLTRESVSTANFLRLECDGANGSIVSKQATIFNNGDAERMRIDSSGNVLVGTTTGGSKVVAEAVPNGTTYLAKWSGTGGTALYLEVGGSAVGSITCTASGTAYNTSSDYRLKENVNYEFDALTRVKELKPARFNFIVDADKTVDGFLAHEVSDIVPEAITGEKDAIDEEGNPDYQDIDQSKLVPLLTKAIQEQQEQIEALQSEINTLKGGD
jgi:hypothetical protein